MTSDISSSSISPSRFSTPTEIRHLYGCRWAWCRLAFPTGQLLTKHVLEDHVATAQLVKRKHIQMLRRVEEGVGHSLSMSGMWSRVEPPSSLPWGPETASVDAVATSQPGEPSSQSHFLELSPSQRPNGAQYPTDSQHDPQPSASRSSVPHAAHDSFNSSSVLREIVQRTPTPNPNIIHFPTTPQTQPKISSDHRTPQFTTLMALSSPLGTPPVPSLPPSPEFHSLVDSAIQNSSRIGDRGREESPYIRSVDEFRRIYGDELISPERAPQNGGGMKPPPQKQAPLVSQPEIHPSSQSSSTSSRGIVELQLTNASDTDEDRNNIDEHTSDLGPASATSHTSGLNPLMKHNRIVATAYPLKFAQAEEDSEVLSPHLQWPALEEERNSELSGPIEPLADPQMQPQLISASRPMASSSSALMPSITQINDDDDLYSSPPGFVHSQPRHIPSDNGIFLPSALRGLFESQTMSSQSQVQSQAESHHRSQSESGPRQISQNIFRSGSLRIQASSDAASPAPKNISKRTFSMGNETLRREDTSHGDGMDIDVENGAVDRSQANSSATQSSQQMYHDSCFNQFLLTQAPYLSQSFDISQ